MGGLQKMLHGQQEDKHSDLLPLYVTICNHIYILIIHCILFIKQYIYCKISYQNVESGVTGHLLCTLRAYKIDPKTEMTSLAY